MLPDFEIFSPVLCPVVLEMAAAPPATGAGTEAGELAALAGAHDAAAVAALKAALRDLDLARFSGRAHEELTMAGRRIAEEAAQYLPASDNAAVSRLAILDSAWQDFREGTLVLVQTTPAATVAFVASGARASQDRGSVLLRRSAISLARPAHEPQPLHTGEAVADTSFKIIDMAKPLLPKPFAGMITAATTVLDLFCGDSGPTPAEVIIKAMQETVRNAVTELESFISDEKLKDITAKINGAYRWLHEAAIQAQAASTLSKQTAYARLALREMEPHVRDLKEKLDRLVLVSIPGNKAADVRARTKASRLYFLGTLALFTLDKLCIQFHAFLAEHETGDAAKAEHRANVEIAYTAFKVHVLGDNRPFDTFGVYRIDRLGGDNSVEAMAETMPGLGDKSFIQAYMDMAQGLVRDRASLVVVWHMQNQFAGLLVMLQDLYISDQKQHFGFDSWNNRMASMGLPPHPEYTRFDEAGARARVASKIARDYVTGEKLNENADALNRYIKIVRDWDLTVKDWNAVKTIAAPTTTVTQTRIAG